MSCSWEVWIAGWLVGWIEWMSGGADIIEQLGNRLMR